MSERLAVRVAEERHVPPALRWHLSPYLHLGQPPGSINRLGRVVREVDRVGAPVKRQLVRLVGRRAHHREGAMSEHRELRRRRGREQAAGGDEGCCGLSPPALGQRVGRSRDVPDDVGEGEVHQAERHAGRQGDRAFPEPRLGQEAYQRLDGEPVQGVPTDGVAVPEPLPFRHDLGVEQREDDSPCERLLALRDERLRAVALRVLAEQPLTDLDCRDEADGLDPEPLDVHSPHAAKRRERAGGLGRVDPAAAALQPLQLHPRVDLEEGHRPQRLLELDRVGPPRREGMHRRANVLEPVGVHDRSPVPHVGLLLP
mmetsp:Transcript_33200/g.99323  ORF Transcript_33200/g.99323 Transcript_33200/m.99323 type:complete len:314 (-) Transcript_33200:261-1202(-)